MKPISSHRSPTLALLVYFTAVVWATEADPRDREIQKDLEFFQAMEVVEAMPMLTEFGEVIDQIKKNEKGEEAP